jgi:cell division initiation protein
MKVTPLDLRQQRFKTAMRGFDRNEVLAFLAELADDYEQALRETDRLREALGRSEALVNEHRQHERNLQNTLLTAQRLSDEVKTTAEQDARRIVREAEGRAELLLEKTRARLEDLQREIDGLRLKRHDAESALEATIAALRNALEFVREQGQRDRDDKLPSPRPKSDTEAVPPSGAAPAGAEVEKV